jgi:hypothetical protein
VARTAATENHTRDLAGQVKRVKLSARLKSFPAAALVRRFAGELAKPPPPLAMYDQTELAVAEVKRLIMTRLLNPGRSRLSMIRLSAEQNIPRRLWF